MTTNNPDPLEVWEEAYGAFVFADDGAQYQAAAAIIAQHYATVIAENERLREAILEVVGATRAYIPPDGIDAKECIGRILGATDNPAINSIIEEVENGVER